jgi:hypothetical protein
MITITGILLYLEGKKTYIAVIATILYALIVQGWMAGDWAVAMQMISTALIGAGIRSSISKINPPATFTD